MNFATLKESPSLRAQLQAAEGVYVISSNADPELIKVGMATTNKPGQPTRSIYKRLQEFQTCFPRGFRLHNLILTDTPLEAEKQMHRELVRLGAKRIPHQGIATSRDSEWFKTTQAQVEKAIQNIAKAPGFYARRIIRVTSRKFHDLVKPQDLPPTHRSTISCREVKTTRFEDYITEVPSAARQVLRARIQRQCK